MNCINIKLFEEGISIPDIKLTRIDNRLVHGQVGITWTNSVGANLIVVADDDVAKDQLQQQLMGITAQSAGAGIRFYTVEQCMNTIHKASPKQKIFLVCRTPKVVRQLIDGGVPIDNVNVGNMHYEEGKRKLTKKVYVDDSDYEDLKYIQSKGVRVYIQDVPGDSIHQIE